MTDMTAFERQLYISGLTRSGLAEKLKITDAAVRKWCDGRGKPHPKHVAKIARLLKMKPADVLDLFVPPAVAA